MQKAIFCGVLFNKKRNFSVKRNLHGITKMSGNIGDAIKFGKLAIFPENYPSKYSFIIPEKEV